MLFSMIKATSRYLSLVLLVSFLNSCSSIESTFDSTVESISEVSEYFYDSVAFWEENEPEQEQAIIVEEAVEVPDFALPTTNQINQNFVQPNQQFIEQQPIQSIQPNYGYYPQPPIYRSARQYFSVTPNGTPMPAPPPPPFPQYSIESNPNVPYSYGANYDYMNRNPDIQNYSPSINNIQNQPQPNFLTEDQEMELFGIENNCIRVVKDYISGGYECDDFD